MTSLASRPVPALAALLLLSQLGGCALLRAPVQYPQQPPASPARTVPAPAATAPTGAVAQAPQAPAVAPPQPPPVATRHYQLGAAATALVGDARRQSAAGNPMLAIGTLERALRIEPGNPLLWIELGQAHQGAGHYAQAGDMGHKALQLATGDPRAQSAAWRLIAESLRARGRNPEALAAQQRADQLGAR